MSAAYVLSIGVVEGIKERNTTSMILSDADDLFLPAGLGVVDSVVRAALGLCDLELGCGPGSGNDASTQR